MEGILLLVRMLCRRLCFFLSTIHGKIIAAGLVVGLCFLFSWMSLLFTESLDGSGLVFVVFSSAWAFHRLWKERENLLSLEASEGDRVIGYAFVLTSVFLFPFVRISLWPQSLLWLFIMAGIAISSWGVQFFRLYPIVTLLLALTVYPKPGTFAKLVWQAFTPYQFLERMMAQGGAMALRFIGQPAIADGPYLAIPPNGAVEVDWGCNGFTMALTMAVAGFFMGIFFKQNWVITLAMMLAGAILALMFNVPRIMLLTMASVYWGQASFDFWHGTWGGQLFTGVLFTVYYYAVMAMVKRRPVKAT
jgi:exosortase/archaeosortase family protein